jgi:MoaA/NifB/PqqE/SkfB family radical SAM enzyme
MHELVIEHAEMVREISGKNLSIITNGTLIHQFDMYKLASAFTFFYVSLNGDEQFYDSHIGKGVFDVITRNIAKLSKYREVELDVTIHKKNINLIPYFIDLASELDVSAIKFKPIIYSGRAKTEYSQYRLTPADLKTVVLKMVRKKLVKKTPLKIATSIQKRMDIINHPCRIFACSGCHPEESIHSNLFYPRHFHIYPEGNVYIDTRTTHSRHFIGNIHEKTLPQMIDCFLKSDQIKELKQFYKHLYNKAIVHSENDFVAVESLIEENIDDYFSRTDISQREILV